MVVVVSGILIAVGIGFLGLIIRDYWLHRQELVKLDWIRCGLLGFITNGLNVLGIGSFAPTTAGLRLLKQTDDTLLPGTLNVSCTLPVIIQAIVFIKVIEVEPVTLIGMFVAASIGSYLGAGVVVKLPAQKIRVVIGIALYVAAFFMLAGQFQWLSGGGDAVGLRGVRLVVAILCNGVFGALMTAGVGLYAPCMALICLLGMSPSVAFPIMMGSCAFLLPISSLRFIRTGKYDRKTTLVLQVSGMVGIVVGVSIVISLPLNILRWIVMVVLLYTATTMLLTVYKNYRTAKSPKGAA
jgi:uncharacterized membrane protein YfcA